MKTLRILLLTELVWLKKSGGGGGDWMLGGLEPLKHAEKDQVAKGVR